jgi:hypothetical protein
MGEVWRAPDLTLDRPVAVKTLLASPADDQRHRALARFRREAKAVARLNHPRIATVHDLDEHQDPPFLVMELLAGPDLAALRVVWSGPLWKGSVSGETLADQILLEQSDRIVFIDAHTSDGARVIELDPATFAFNVRASPRCVVMDVGRDSPDRAYRKECRALTGELRWRTPYTESQGGFLRFAGDALIWSTGLMAGPGETDWSFACLDPDTGAALWGCSFTTTPEIRYPEVATVGDWLLINIEGDIFRSNNPRPAPSNVQPGGGTRTRRPAPRRPGRAAGRGQGQRPKRNRWPAS